MSDCKKFGVNLDGSKSPEERLADLERIWPLIQSKIQSYDEVMENVKPLYMMPSSVESMENSFLERFRDVEKNFQQALTRINSLEKSVQDHVSHLENKSEKLNALHEIVKKEIDSRLSDVGISIESIKSHFQNLFSSSAKNSEVEFIKDFIEKKFQILSSELQTVQIKHSENYTDLQNVKSSSQDGQSMINKISNDMVLLGNQISQIQSKMKSLNSDMTDIAKQTIDGLKNSLDNKLSNLRSDINATPSSVEILKQELSKKMESVLLDGSNAVLKSNNNAQQIVILEKKIENLYLLLKKMELSK